MIVFIAVFIAVGCILTFPAYLLARRAGMNNFLLLFLSAPSIVVWMILTALGIGAQSLANIIEIFYLFIGGVVLSYLQVLIFKKHKTNTFLVSGVIVIVLCLAALLLRLLMPVIPE